MDGATAADIALLIGTDGESNATEQSDQIAFMADVLDSRGYEVYDRQSATRADIAAALAQVANRLPETERLILFYAGDRWRTTPGLGCCHAIFKARGGSTRSSAVWGWTHC